MAHEDLTREQQVQGSSDRTFGFVFSGVFLVIALWPLLYGETLRWWSSALAAGFALIALARPTLLARLNRLWTRLGVLLGKVISPIALGILFYAVLTPIGLMIRLAGKDPLRLRRDASVESYWLRREPPGPAPDTIANQF